MGKEYVVQTATLSCEYGTSQIELKVPEHRHITVNDKGLANISDISTECIGCFGACASPYCMDFNNAMLASYGFTNIQQVKTILEEGSCASEVKIPWQNPQPDVNAAYFNALIEGCWTVCHLGLGIISVIYSGQDPATNNQKVMQNLSALEKELDAFMEANGIKEKDRQKLLESILLYDGYDNVFWDRKSDQDTRKFAEYLKKENPALFNFFERQITLKDPSTGKDVDLTYFMGLTKAGIKGSSYMSDIFDPNILNDPARLNAYMDAHNIDAKMYDDVKGMSYAEIIDYYYGLSGEHESKTSSRYDNYVNYISDEAIETNHYYASYTTVDEKKLALAQNVITGGLQSAGYDYEYAEQIGKDFAEQLKNGMKEEKKRR